MIEQPAAERRRRQRGRVEKSLDDVAPEFRKPLSLPVGFDAFGDDGELQALADADHRGHDRARAGSVSTSRMKLRSIFNSRIGKCASRLRLE